MKKKILAILALIAVFSMCFAGTVSAAKAGYGFTIGPSSVTPTVDGAHATDEWNTDSYKDWLYNGWTQTTSFFRDKWGMTDGIKEYFLIEILTDITSDAGDFVQLSYDTAIDGGAAPNADDFLVNVTGHTAGGVAVYSGTGTGWGASGAAVGTDVFVASSIGASPASATPHWIIEIGLLKTGALAMAMSNNNLRIAAYDASNPGVGVLMWPPFSSANVPDTYGAGTTDLANIVPEGLTIGLMVALSSVAVVVSARYFKKPKI